MKAVIDEKVYDTHSCEGVARERVGREIQQLFRTESSAWLLYRRTKWGGHFHWRRNETMGDVEWGPRSYVRRSKCRDEGLWLLTDEEARDWLIRADLIDLAEQIFGLERGG